MSELPSPRGAQRLELMISGKGKVSAPNHDSAGVHLHACFLRVSANEYVTRPRFQKARQVKYH